MAVLDQVRPADVGMSEERLELARDLMHEHVSAGRAPSAAAVVLRHGRVVFAEALGVQRPEGPGLTLDHVWPIASAGKPLTAATVLSLVEEGRIGVMSPITEYLPELADTGNDEVLVHHLLTHSAGWDSDLFSGRLAALLESRALPEPPPGRDLITHMVLSLAMDPVRIAPVGGQMAYGNVSYSLLGEIVRRVTGGTLDAAMRARVLDPLGMTRSALIVGDDLRGHLVQRAPDVPFGSYDPPGLVPFQGELWESSDAGESGLHTSPMDLARFGQAILNGGTLDGARFLSASTVRSMCIDQIPGLAAVFGPGQLMPVASWGYGFGVICEFRWPYFGGGLVPPGSVTHPGAGGVDYWIDFEHGIVGVFFEVLTEISSQLEPISGMGNRFQDVITAAVVA
jgi:CubicO group peptidase (beta-lactamase class C family)